MKHLTLEEFTARLASADPTPGGGSASAVAGAFAAALVGMVARLSVGRGGEDALFTRIAESMDVARASLLDLAQDDADAFEAVMVARRMPRGSDEEKGLRAETLQRALRGAAEVPLEVALRALAVLEAAPAVMRTGNKSAISDAGVAVLLGEAAARGALANVRINLGSIKDEAYRASASGRIEELMHRTAALRDEGMAILQERLNA